jgi:hypothetical protein
VLTDQFRKRFLGICVGERSLAVAQVTAGAAGPMVDRVEEFSFPAGVGLEEGEALGTALRGFLKSKGFSSHCAVIGVPAKWLVVKSHSLPPADQATAATMLGLAAEGDSAPELGEVAFDYAGDIDATKASQVLLMGLPRRWRERVEAVARAARLKVLAITPSGMALSGARGTKARDGLMISMRPEGAELAVVDHGRMTYLRHLASGTSRTAVLAELRRTAAVRGNGSASAVVWDDVGVDDSFFAELESAAGMEVVRGDLRTLGCSRNGVAEGHRGTCAAALGIGALEGKGAGVNFLRPRLAPAKKRNVRRRTVWISAAAACVVLVAVGAYADLARLGSQVSRTERDLKDLDPAFKKAKPFVTNMEFAESFRGSQPPRYLDCMRDVTQMLPEDGQTYLTSFKLAANMKGEFAGRSANNKDVLGLMDKLNSGGRFAELKRKLDARGNGTEVSFSVTFRYAPK